MNPKNKNMKREKVIGKSWRRWDSKREKNTNLQFLLLLLGGLDLLEGSEDTLNECWALLLDGLGLGLLCCSLQDS